MAQSSPSPWRWGASSCLWEDAAVQAEAVCASLSLGQWLHGMLQKSLSGCGEKAVSVPWSGLVLVWACVVQGVKFSAVSRHCRCPHSSQQHENGLIIQALCLCGWGQGRAMVWSIPSYGLRLPKTGEQTTQQLHCLTMGKPCPGLCQTAN